jgi:peroxiredoxin Q/BCP
MENKKAPTFILQNQDGQNVSLSDFSGKKVLLYFYPKDMTPGCTIEAIGLSEKKKAFENRNTVVIGISRDPVEKHKKFCDKENLEIMLLSDENGTVVKDYGVWQEKNMFGKTHMGISRESFLIDEQGSIIKHWTKVQPAKHPKEVLDWLDTHE